MTYSSNPRTASVLSSFEERPRTFQAAVADEAALRRAIEEADVVPQLLVQAQLSGETDLLDEARPYIQGAWSFMQQIPAGLAARIRDRLVQALKARASCESAPSQPTSRQMYGNLMSVGIGQPIPDDYVTMMLEEIEHEGGDRRRVHWRRPIDPSKLESFRVVISGAGLSGICMGLKLREAGIPFTIFEKNAGVGGTWYENTYPGCGVDIPNHFYSFSFERNPNWSRHFAKQEELWRYLDELTDKHDLRRHIRFSTEVIEARFDETAENWQITVCRPDGKTEAVVANVFVPAVGLLNRPSIPNITGLNAFQGPVFHTASWDHRVDLVGKRVGLIGTGASSMQAGPSIADKVSHLSIFQRSRHWALPHPLYHQEVSPGMKWALANIPLFAEWHRFLLFWASGDALHPMLRVDPNWPTPQQSLNAENHAFRERLLAHLQNELGDRPDLLAKVTPNYPPYGRRMLRDNGWYKMLRRTNVDLVTDHIVRVEEDGIVAETGHKHLLDVIVLGTGFQASRMLWPMEVIGRGGKSIRDEWKDEDPSAYLGTSVPGYPNMFMLAGPNTGLSHGGSFFFIVECQVRYAMQCIREIVERAHASMECRPEVHWEYNRRVDELHSRMVWTHKGVKSWYTNSKGRVTTLAPWRLVDFWKLTYSLDPADYIYRDNPVRTSVSASVSCQAPG
jgi:4-hydroxyacetophenone monooxygenase